MVMLSPSSPKADALIRMRAPWTSQFADRLKTRIFGVPLERLDSTLTAHRNEDPEPSLALKLGGVLIHPKSVVWRAVAVGPERARLSFSSRIVLQMCE
jgi:hypothetical protein